MSATPVKVECANPQLTLAGICNWRGVRQGRLIAYPNGRLVREPPTRKRCPQCGGPVKESVLPVCSS